MSARSRPLRVVQWATGNVGRHAIEAIRAHPGLELVGARVYSEDKAGRDVGELCGLGPIGVVATASTDDVLALPADCVLYAAQGEANPMRAVEDICRLLASGVRIEGAPSMTLEASIAVHGEDENDQGCLGTAMHAVHAIPHVCAAAPGIRTFLDLPMITGRGALALAPAPAA